jgi:hypothetical protein
MMAITTSSSTSVNADRLERETFRMTRLLKKKRKNKSLNPGFESKLKRERGLSSTQVLPAIASPNI